MTLQKFSRSSVISEQKENGGGQQVKSLVRLHVTQESPEIGLSK
jgi:hypothetical protein